MGSVFSFLHFFWDITSGGMEICCTLVAPGSKLRRSLELLKKGKPDEAIPVFQDEIDKESCWDGIQETMLRRFLGWVLSCSRLAHGHLWSHWLCEQC